MDKTKQKDNPFIEIDVLQIAKALWHRAWIILLAAILCGAIGFGYAAYFITPTYSSSIMLYINSNGLDIGSSTIKVSMGDLSLSTRLISTYSIILKNRTTLEMVRDELDLPYSWGQLNGMISTSSVNDTEIMRITVTCDNPEMAAKIANGVATVLPKRVTEIVSGCSMAVLDSAIPQYGKIAPNVSSYARNGLLIGILISAGLIALLAILDNTIHSEEYIASNYDLPILAKVPNLTSEGQKKYGYYYRYNSYRQH